MSETSADARSTSPSHELDAPPWLRVESTLMSTARSIREAYDAAMAPLDLNLTNASLLAYAAEQGPISQSALAEKLGVGRAAAGSIVDRLQTMGLVERVADIDDRRVWLINVTPEGKEVTVKIADIDADVRSRLRRGISREERQLLANLLVHIQENLRPTIT